MYQYQVQCVLGAIQVLRSAVRWPHSVEQSAYQPPCKRQPCTIQETFKDLSFFYLMCLDCSDILFSDRLTSHLSFILGILMVHVLAGSFCIFITLICLLNVFLLLIY